jgi:hypothetical protein
VRERGVHLIEPPLPKLAREILPIYLRTLHLKRCNWQQRETKIFWSVDQKTYRAWNCAVYLQILHAATHTNTHSHTHTRTLSHTHTHKYSTVTLANTLARIMISFISGCSFVSKIFVHSRLHVLKERHSQIRNEIVMFRLIKICLYVEKNCICHFQLCALSTMVWLIGDSFSC